MRDYWKAKENANNSAIHDSNDIRLGHYSNCLRRDHHYVALLEHYVQNQKKTDNLQITFKIIFFVIVCGLFIATVILGSLSIWNISKKDDISWQDIGIALAGLGSLLGVIIVLPSKIAEHLFPAGGNQSSINFINSMQQYDLSINSSSCKASTDMEDIVVEITDNKENDSSDIHS